MKVELCRLSDGKVSVRVDGIEVAILPVRRACSLDDLERGMQKIADFTTDPTLDAATLDRIEELIADLKDLEEW